jgi:hypothetical protein
MAEASERGLTIEELTYNIDILLRDAVAAQMETERKEYRQRIMELENLHGMRKVTSPEDLAKLYHYIYERRAPEFNIETIEDEREWDPNTSTSQLRIAVLTELMRAGFIMT